MNLETNDFDHLPEHIIKQKELKRMAKSIADLKFQFEFPRLYLSNYFEELRNEIDLSIAKKMQQKPNEEIKRKLTEDYIQIIDRINSFENSCFKIRAANKFSNEFSDRIKHSIEIIDAKVTHLKRRKHPDIYDFMYYVLEIDDLVYEVHFQIEKLLFQNKTILFLDKETAKISKLFDTIFDCKLIIISNGYFSKKGLNSITK